MTAPAHTDGEAPVEPPVLEAGAVFRGLVTFRGEATVAGRVEGDVIALGTLTLEAGGQVDGRIEVDVARIAGRVHGSIRARKRIDLLADAEVDGDLRAPIISLDDGGRLRGRCLSGPAADRPEPGPAVANA